MFRSHLAAFVTVFLLAGSAMAQEDDNLAIIDQDGADNVGDITQAGQRNQLGTEGDPALQSGYYNNLTLLQVGTDNRVGTMGRGLDQDGQAATPRIFNSIDIRQQTSDNTVGEVQQIARGAIPDGANRLDVTQQGGDGNMIDSVVQIQNGSMPGQSATLVQTGPGNRIARVEQQSLTAADGEENTINATFIGEGNGTIALSGRAAESRATSSALIQTMGEDGLGANGNEMDLRIEGDFNGFGIYQGGRQNSVGQITIVGLRNQMGVRQDGYENILTVSLVSGDGNDIGVQQWGTNTAFLDLPGATSDDNVVSIFQDGTNDIEVLVDGSRNTVLTDQDYDDDGNGGNNEADIDVIGADNLLDLAQRGTNTANIRINGNYNNAFDFTTPRLNQVAGQVRQVGSGNNLTAEVEGDQNLFATTQSGDGNLTTLTVSGTLNEAELLQSGMNNTAGVNQQGSGNRATISQ